MNKKIKNNTNLVSSQLCLAVMPVTTACQNLKVDYCATCQHRYATTIIRQPPALYPLWPPTVYSSQTTSWLSLRFGLDGVFAMRLLKIRKTYAWVLLLSRK